MTRALPGDAALLVYPGGDEETYRPSWDSSQVGFGGRTGLVELALERYAPMVPVIAIGGHETALFLGRGRGLANALQLNRLLRRKVLPLMTSTTQRTLTRLVDKQGFPVIGGGRACKRRPPIQDRRLKRVTALRGRVLALASLN